MSDELGPGPHNPMYGQFTDEVILEGFGGPCILGAKLTTLCEDYEYAGFRYRIDVDYDQGQYFAFPLPNQHPAANKERHQKSAIECYLEDNQNGN